MKLAEILDSEELIIADGCIRARDESDFCWKIYHSMHPGFLNSESLKEQIEVMQGFKQIFQNPNVYSIEEVTAEVREFERIVGEKIKFFNSGNTPRRKRRKRVIKKQNKEVKNLLENLHQEIYQSRRLSENSQLEQIHKLKDSNYNLLLDMVKLIGDERGLKKDTAFRMGKHTEDRSQNSDTDEKLVSSLYWLSLFSNKSPCLLTRDRDFLRLLEPVTRLIGSDCFLPYNQTFRDAILKNPFKLYFESIEGYNQKVLSSEIQPKSSFFIYGPKTKSSEQIKYELTRMWEQFESNTSSSTPQDNYSVQTSQLKTVSAQTSSLQS